MTSKYCVYIHRKESDGSPFYIGKGIESRARSKNCRSIRWHRTVAKHGVTITIAKANMPEPCAFALERALISSYGRENLCNLTDGGEGTSGRTVSASQREKCSISNKGNKPAPHSIVLARKKNSKPVGTRCGLRFSSVTEAAKHFKPEIWRAAKTNICQCAAGKTGTAYGYEWGYIRNGEPAFLYKSRMSQPRPERHKAVVNGSGTAFKSIGAAVEWLKQNGWPKANTGAVCRGAKYGTLMYGQRWHYA